MVTLKGMKHRPGGWIQGPRSGAVNHDTKHQPTPIWLSWSPELGHEEHDTKDTNMDRYQLCVTFDNGDTSEIEHEFDHVLDTAEVKEAIIEYLGGWFDEDGAEAVESVGQITGAVMYEIDDDDLPTGDAIAKWKFEITVAGDEDTSFSFHFNFGDAGKESP